MNIFYLSTIATVINISIITIILLLKGPRKAINRIFLGVTISGVIWGVGGIIFSRAPQPAYELALFGWQLSYIGVILSPVFYTHFIQRYLNIKTNNYFRLIYLSAFIFIFLNLFDNSRYFLGDIRFVYNQFYWHDWIANKNIIYIIFYIFFYWVLLGYSLILLMMHYRHATGVQRNQMRYFMLGSIIGWIGGEGCFLTDFRIDVYPFFNLFLALYPILIAYGMIKYRLMDIKVAITRAGIFIAVYTFVLGFPFAIGSWLQPWLSVMWGANWWFVPMGVMAVLATVGPFVYIYIDHQAEERLLKEQRRYQNTLKQASMGMTRIRNLKKLLKLIVYTITRSVRINYACMYLLDMENQHFNMEAIRDKGRLNLPQIQANTALIRWLIAQKEPLVGEEIKRQLQDKPTADLEELKNQMEMLSAAVIIPSLVEDRLLGFVVLGEKRSGDIYSEDDLQVFTVLANQAALAIENARFFENAKEMQDQISQAEKMATIGTMADGLSHQINNRFHALSLIAGDTLDTLKITDTASYAQEQKDLFAQVQHGLERIMVNVSQGGEIVQGMLKYTRKGEEGFVAVPLDKVLDSTLDMVQYKIKLSEIDIVRDYPHSTPPAYGNLTQLQEVFFNLIDNAYDAMVERRDTLKEEGYRGRIRIYAEPSDDNMLRITIEDNGMGVKVVDFRKMFTPFFTTKTSSRKGTGLGLYVIKKIVADNHRGKISVESAYKQGTKFTLQLPIAR